MSEKNQVLTSVKIDTDLFDKFKIECIKRKFSFQKLSERSINYIIDLLSTSYIPRSDMSIDIEVVNN